ncbi:MAG TPA: elongation factor G [Candidatus Paceibacterota bacterium]|nr:elongation factor G [Candidatus Paceibacterota bacterium]
MPREYPIEKTRNIGIIAHIDAGKTTTTERILFYTGLSHKIGNIDDGNTTTDWMVQERERGITITSAAVTCYWTPTDMPKEQVNKCKINIIDTPGHIDFTAEVQRSLRVLDGAVVVFDGVAGVEPQSETVWHQADKYDVPRICFINKMDRMGANYVFDYNSILERLSKKAILFNFPIGAEDKLEGVIDLLTMRAVYFKGEKGEIVEYGEIPADLKADADKWRARLVEMVASEDDALLEKYLDGKEITVDELKAVTRKATIACKINPVFCGSSFRNKGVQPVLDAVVEYLPSPIDLPAIVGTDPKTGAELKRNPDDKEPFSALAFKIVTDPYVGTLTFFRVYSGSFQKGNYLLNASKGEKERISRIMRMYSNERIEMDDIYAGDIAATVGLKNTLTGDTLCDPDHPITLENITFPEPVISLKIEPKTKDDSAKMGLALKKLSDEDPTFKIHTDPDTLETIISGMGELHLDIIVDRLRREFNVEVNTGKPQVAYKEAIKGTAEAEGKYIKQSGGKGQYGHVWLKIEPLADKEFEFINAIKGGVIPQEFIPAVKKGVIETLDRGILAGYPVKNIQVTLYDGSYHEVDSSEMAFKIAASMALQEGFRRAQPIILEPIMKVEIVIPEKFLGDVIGDINSRRGRIDNIGDRSMMKIIDAKVPLSEMFGYTTQLRSMTEGRGSSNLEFSNYEEAPRNIADTIISGRAAIRAERKEA